MLTFEELHNIFNAELQKRSIELDAQKPAGLYSPVCYSLDAGGKRLRPVLLLMAYNFFHENVKPALPAAMAIEVFHNFTLLHDDIMDKSEMRRNNPTVHIKYGENSAILSGDAMAFLSYRYLMESGSLRMNDVLDLFTQTALEVCEGQQYDMEYEKREFVSETEYMEMIRLKTAVLLGCSLKCGALLSNSTYKIADDLYDLGINLGLAFQIQDDWLDTFGNSKEFGKRIGGDIIAGKQTYLLVKALEVAEKETKLQLRSLLLDEEIASDKKIKSVLEIYNILNIKELALKQIQALFTNAETILRQIELEENRKIRFHDLVVQMQKRSY